MLCCISIFMFCIALTIVNLCCARGLSFYEHSTRLDTSSLETRRWAAGSRFVCSCWRNLDELHKIPKTWSLLQTYLPPQYTAKSEVAMNKAQAWGLRFYFRQVDWWILLFSTNDNELNSGPTNLHLLYNWKRRIWKVKIISVGCRC